MRVGAALAGTALVATLALTGCLPMPTAPVPSAPSPTIVPAPSSAPAPEAPDPSTAFPDATAEPSVPGGDLEVVAEGSAAHVTVDGYVWDLELLEVAEVDLADVAMFAEDDDEAVPPPDGQELVWACFSVTYTSGPEETAWAGSQLSFAIDGYDQGTGWDYEVIDYEIDYYGASAGVGETRERMCPLFVVPEGTPRDEVTVIATDEAFDTAEAVVATP